MVKIFHADDPKTWVHAILGLILLALGGIPLLSQFGVIAFTVPSFVASLIGQFAVWVIAAVGIWLIIDALMEDHAMKNVTITIAFVFLAIGVIQLLNQFGVIGFSIPFLSLSIYSAIFVIEGLFLIIAIFATF